MGTCPQSSTRCSRIPLDGRSPTVPPEELWTDGLRPSEVAVARVWGRSETVPPEELWTDGLRPSGDPTVWGRSETPPGVVDGRSPTVRSRECGDGRDRASAGRTVSPPKEPVGGRSPTVRSGVARVWGRSETVPPEEPWTDGLRPSEVAVARVWGRSETVPPEEPWTDGLRPEEPRTDGLRLSSVRGSRPPKWPRFWGRSETVPPESRLDGVSLRPSEARRSLLDGRSPTAPEERGRTVSDCPRVTLPRFGGRESRGRRSPTVRVAAEAWGPSGRAVDGRSPTVRVGGGECGDGQRPSLRKSRGRTVSDRPKWRW